MQLLTVSHTATIRLNDNPGGCIKKSIEIPGFLPVDSLIILRTPQGTQSFRLSQYVWMGDEHELIIELRPERPSGGEQISEWIAANPDAWQQWSECTGPWVRN